EIAQIVLKSRKTGSIYIGGGVPKNYINDAAVMLDYTPGHSYVFQITTDAPHWGGLTGSTLDEAKSWGKVSKKATRATAYVEATIGLPLVASYVLHSKELVRNRKRIKFIWNDDELLEIRHV
ncbi:MAG: deoxyhypusine synthase family protein, partial [Nitrososphaerota archaeon]|nr:deoxyhypusine synthase family protein [Nitrososphaerota archaeon]